MEEQINFAKISHEKWLYSPPPVFLGKCLIPVSAGRPAVNKHKSLDSLVGQENKCPGRMFCAQNPQLKSEQQAYCLCGDTAVSSRDGDSNVMAKSNLGLCPCSCGGSADVSQPLQRNLMFQYGHKINLKRTLTEVQDLNKHPTPSCIYKWTSA